MAPICICPHADSSNEIVNNAKYLTLDQAAAVASGYFPCCGYWAKSKEFIHANPNMANEISLWHQQLQQEVASGELRSKVDRLNRTERLIDREVLKKRLAKRESEATGIPAQPKSDATPASSGQAWISTARAIGKEIVGNLAKKERYQNQLQVAEMVYAEMKEMENTGESGVNWHSRGIPSAETIKRRALKGLILKYRHIAKF